MAEIKIGRKIVGDRGPVFIIAEVSANHGQDFKKAVSMIKMAKYCGADAVKFQAYTPDTITISSDNKYFKVKHAKWGGQTLYSLYKKAYTPYKWFKKLKNVADDLGILFFATAFDKTAVDLLEGINVGVHKISSFELVDLPLIAYAAKTGKPIILSVGMATISEIREAVKTAKSAGAKGVVLLKCVSSYPANPSDMNLRTISDMQKLFKCVIGLSDHSLGFAVSIAGVSLGARVVEKHFTLSKRIKTPDSFFSLEPLEFKALVDNIRIAEKALGKVHYGLTKEEKSAVVFRRSLFAVKDIKKGERFSEENIRSIRPAFGLRPKYLNDILLKEASRNIKKGTPLNWKLVFNIGKHFKRK